MGFGRQLRVLLWKNFLIRSRQKLWMFLEICWPLCMFLILVWVRSTNAAEKHHECHYPARALPSAGFLPFLQSYFCTIRNTCHKEPFDDDHVGRVNHADHSLLSKVGILVEEFLNQPSGTAAGMSETMSRRINRILHDDPAESSFGGAYFFDLLQFQGDLSKSRLFSTLTRLEPLLSLANSSHNFLTAATCGEVGQETAERMFPVKPYQARLQERFKMDAKPHHEVGGGGGMGNGADVFSPPPGDNTTMSVVCEQFLVSAALEAKCATWLSSFRQVRNSIFSEAFTMLRGHILVTPDTPATRELVKTMEEWLQGFSFLNDVVLDFTLNAELYQDALANSTLAKTYWGLVRTCSSKFSKLLPFCQDALRLMEKYRGFFVNSTDPDAMLPHWKEVLLPAAPMLECFLTDRFRFVATERELEDRAVCLSGMDKFFAALVFLDLENETETEGQHLLPPIVQYKIRMPTMLVGGNALSDGWYGPRPRDNQFIDLKYMTFGLTFLQDAVDRAIIRAHTNESQMAGVYMQQFPTPCYQSDAFSRAIERLLPMLMILAWVCSASLIIKNIVYEKEMRLKEFMRVMGLGNLVHWLAWFVQSFVFVLVSACVLVVVLKYGRVIERSDPTILLLFILLFTVATIAQCFLISTFFDKANVAAACGAVIYELLYSPYWVAVQFAATTTYARKLASCLSAQVAFGWGCSVIAHLEAAAVGVQWDNIADPVPGNNFTLLDAMLMLVADTFLYLLLTWYIEAVFPGQYGVPRPFYFFLTKSYWCGHPPARLDDSSFQPAAQDTTADHVEPGPTDRALGVAVRDLKKVYPNGKVALRGVTLDFYRSQITSFLGHNGAGKTTTLSILTGLIPPSDGTVLVDGQDVRTHIDQIRRSLGMCPQHDILFGRLTVRQQLKFYAGLRGVPAATVDGHVIAMIEQLGLTAKADTLVDHLSGGTQRRLSVAVAFIGDSKTVILDEPTAGVDPCARRLIWDLLLRNKEGRTIILSTHFMDEADVLGDRIAIIGDGRVKCCGSSMFLKKTFGADYRLTMVRNGAPDEAVTRTLDQFIQHRLTTAQLAEDTGHELIYRLPAHDPALLQGFFADFEANLDKFGLSSYGVSEAKLEEIFLKVAGEPGPDEVYQGSFCPSVRRAVDRWRKRAGRKSQQPMDDLNLVDSSGEESDKETARVLATESAEQLYDRANPVTVFLRQLRALLVKRFVNFRRNIKGAFCEILMPILLIGVVLYLLGLKAPSGPGGDPGALPLVPWMYGGTFVFQSLADPEPDVNQAGRMYMDAMNDPPGMGIRCAQNQSMEEWMPCDPIDNSSWVPPAAPTPTYTNSCECDSRSVYVCPLGAYQPPPPVLPTNTTDWLVNVTGDNITRWLMMTDEQYRTSRFGGFSFGERNIAALENVSWPVVDENLAQLAQLFDNLTTMAGIDWRAGHRRPWSAMHAANASFQTTMSEMDKVKALLHGLQVRSNVKVWFNNRAWIAGPAFASVLSNAVLRAHLPPGEDPTRYGIVTINHPMNGTMLSKAERIAQYNLGRLSFEASMVILAFSVVPASFVLFIIEENVVFSKHLQMVSGVRPFLYWISNYIWDMGNFLLPAVGTMLIFVLFNEQAYIGWASTGMATFLLLVLYGFAVVPMMYPFTFVFRVPSLAFVSLAMGNAFIGWVATITTLTLEIIGEYDQNLIEINDLLMTIFLIFPQYCLGRGLLDIKVGYFLYLKELFLNGDVASPANPFQWSVAGRNMFCLFVSGCGWFAVVLLIEYRLTLAKWLSPMISAKHSSSEENRSSSDEDEDVRKERQLIDAEPKPDRFALVIMNLRKVFTRGCCCHRAAPFTAVDRLCVGVKPGQCFGLLGVNGAGKTTTFSMLTGKLSMTSGDALVYGSSVHSEANRALSRIGYCPQFDAVHPLLTGREELRFYARLRSIKPDRIEKVVSRVIGQLGLNTYADHRSGGYSGGNRRKLSAAIALLGKPDLVLLDEPTTGMDPKARRALWNRILHVTRQGGTSVLLTSHSMEECEVLCHRIGIMVNGRFQCLGSAQHLKSRFGRGYTLTVKLGGTTTAAVDRTIQLIQDRFPGAVVQERHAGQVRLRLPAGTRSLSDLFQCLVQAGPVVQDYTLCQTTLEDVFIQFANQQGDRPSD